MKIAIVAGEVSGDILGAGLIRELKQIRPDLDVYGIAGPLMKKEGCDPLFDMEELSVMGLVEVLGRLPRILQIRRQLIKQLLDNPPDLFIGIDAPDFNLDLELKFKQAGIKTVHYVSPSVWAWKRKRVFKMKKALDLVMVFMPFEKRFYDQYQVPCRFVGHTLADQIPMATDHRICREKLSLPVEGQYLALLPGSRVSEVKQLTPVFLETAILLRQRYPDLKFIVPLVSEKIAALFNEIWHSQQPDLELTTIIGRAREVIGAADRVLLASGTAALETMLVNRPMVVAYRLNALTYFIAKRLVKTDYISLPNLLAGKKLIPELIQDECNPQALCLAVSEQLDSDCSALSAQFSLLHQQIAKGADRQAAEAVLSILEQSDE